MHGLPHATAMFPHLARLRGAAEALTPRSGVRGAEALRRRVATARLGGTMARTGDTTVARQVGRVIVLLAAGGAREEDRDQAGRRADLGRFAAEVRRVLPAEEPAAQAALQARAKAADPSPSPMPDWLGSIAASLVRDQMGFFLLQAAGVACLLWLAASLAGLTLAAGPGRSGRLPARGRPGFPGLGWVVVCLTAALAVPIADLSRGAWFAAGPPSLYPLFGALEPSGRIPVALLLPVAAALLALVRWAGVSGWVEAVRAGARTLALGGSVLYLAHALWAVPAESAAIQAIQREITADVYNGEERP